MLETSVYIHFPWCARKCPYCDFATTAKAPAEVDHEAYADAVLRELERRREHLSGRRLYSVFFGGGTPSMWAPKSMGRVLEAIRAAFDAEHPELEVSAEANPASIDDDWLLGIRDQGVQRVSIGVQSLGDAQLKHLGRLHDRKLALAAVGRAANIMPRASADLIFGLPHQSAEALLRDAAALLDLGLRHLSAYALTIEPGTQFGELHRLGRLQPEPDESYIEHYQALEGFLRSRGFSHYEVSNYALPGEESRHNLHYWRGQDYLGLGAAAVGALASRPGQGERYKNALDAGQYMAGAGPAEWEPLGGTELVQEALMLGLRTQEGVSISRTESRAGQALSRGREAALEERAKSGDILIEGDRISVPHDRWLLMDSIVGALF